MLNNLSRPVPKNNAFAKRLYCALVMSMIAANRVCAEDEIIEFEPDNSILGRLFDLLHDLWNFMDGLLF